jgi:glycosyltransferase involved in cell wall biosynthesis
LSTPLVSVIIPTFNREKELERALISLIGQTYANWEGLIVDNHSLDNTVNLINSFNDSRLKLHMINNYGIIGMSRNLGAKYSDGKYLAFLDSDDWWKSDKLEKSVKILEECKVGLIYHDLFLATKKNQKFYFKKTRSRNLLKPVFNDLIINGNSLITSSVVIRKDILNKVSGFSLDKRLITIEDYDAWLKIAKMDETFYKINEVLGYYWAGGNNTSNPKMTIKVLDNLKENYKNQINQLSLIDKTYWIEYSKARAYYKIKLREKSLDGFNAALNMNPIFKIKVKILFMIFMLKIQIFLMKE